jgi:hypothetical protein
LAAPEGIQSFVFLAKILTVATKETGKKKKCKFENLIKIWKHLPNFRNHKTEKKNPWWAALKCCGG